MIRPRRQPISCCGSAFQVIRSLFIFPCCLYSGAATSFGTRWLLFLFFSCWWPCVPHRRDTMTSWPCGPHCRVVFARQLLPHRLIVIVFLILSSETNYFSSASQDIFEFILQRLIAPATFFGLQSSLSRYSFSFYFPILSLLRRLACTEWQPLLLSRVDCFFVSLMFVVSHTLIVVLVSCCAFCNG